MTEFTTLNLNTASDGITHLVLNRPHKHNALNAEMIGELRKASKLISANDAIRAVILSARGKSFCAGGDLAWMQQQADKDRAGKIQESSELANMLRDLDNLPKPIVACVQGPAYGGGIGIMSICDIVVASDLARFALTETRLGLIPATIGPYVVRRLGEGAARQIFLNASIISAERAQHLGLVSITAPPDRIEEIAEKQARAFLKCAPGAVADSKALCQFLARNPGQDSSLYTANRLADRWETEEARQGISSFFAKKNPPWTKG